MMNIMKKKIFAGIALAAVIGLTTSCKDYLDINDNPNTPVVATSEILLTNALNVTAARLGANEIGAFWSGQWSPSGSVSGFVPEKTYDITTTFRTNIWEGPYDNMLDYSLAEGQARTEKKSSVVGMALVMKAYNFQILVDAYGNVPFNDALKGTAVIRPTYEAGEDVYDQLATILDSAVYFLSFPIDGTNPSAGSADIYFGGDTELWRKFANTLKLRLLVRQSGIASKEAALTEQITALAESADGFLGAGQDVTSSPGYLKSAGKMNPFYENYGYSAGNARAGNHDFYTYTAYWVDNMISTNDTLRLARYAYLPANPSFTDYRGVPLGEGSDEYLYSKISGFGPAFIPTDGTAGGSNLYARRQVIMLAAESFFLQAEAMQRGLMPGGDAGAKAAYEQGIKEAFRYVGLTAANATAYYSQPIVDVNWDASGDKIRAIITQKWIALTNVGGFEAWTEFRRTGYPDAPLSTRAGSNPHPVRLLYPLTEYSLNRENVEAQGSIDQFDSKIFWDVD
jgi:hypothetical protein